MAEITPRDMKLLSSFISPKTIQEGADELGLSYAIVVREVRRLIKLGYMAEMPFRDGKKRIIFTRKAPSDTETRNREHQFYWHGELKSFMEITKKILVGATGSFAFEFYGAMAVVWYQSWLQAQEMPIMSTNAAEIQTRLRRAILKAKLQIEFAEACLEAPFWTDSKFVHKMMIEAPDINNMKRNAEAYIKLVFTEGKEVLEP